MKITSATIIADSINTHGDRITTMVMTYPRFIHSELMTHRAFSRNAASSRAIRIETMIEQVKTNPAMPIRWGKNGAGMQDHGVLNDQEVAQAKGDWRMARDFAVSAAEMLHNRGVHKQIVNRVLEPFSWITTLVTATEWRNFFGLRVHKDAQPEFQVLAHLALKAYLAHEPQQLSSKQWHVPFGDRMPDGLSVSDQLRVATARCARVSYDAMERGSTLNKDTGLHDRLAAAGHWSAFEHCAQAQEHVRCGNFTGWYQYRYTFPHQLRQPNLVELMTTYEESLRVEKE